MQAVAASDTGIIFAGSSLLNSATGHVFEVEQVEYDPQMQQAFTLAGRKSLTQADLAAVGAHRTTLYVLGSDGSLEAAREMLDVGTSLLKAGGIAVKVETAGVAHSAKDWWTYCGRKDTHVGSLYLAYVVVVRGRGSYYSCGMHNLGLPDAIVTADLTPNEALQLLQGFLLYVLHERPQIQDGHTFSTAANAPDYGLSHEPCETFPPDDLFHNPFGMWRLAKM
jgi:hypothetical protein